MNKYDIKVNSCFTGAFTRLNHLAHPDKDQQKHWINYFKHFFYKLFIHCLPGEPNKLIIFLGISFSLKTSALSASSTS